ncbi:MAG: single-stranded-DNA-specific exonuclease RecJ [Deltaproteobacteria bacterium]|nr:single-stranded-DNA-specific exonuclease RecJ [Deltaproteobacteria bacterium]
MKKRWKVEPPDCKLQDLLAQEFKVSPLTAQLLINRGLCELDRASCFLSPSLQGLHNPFTMKDMDKAVERVIRAIKDGEGVAIYGDYDADGATATALLYLFLKDVGADVTYYIPDRLKEGYSLNSPALARLAHNGVKVVITTDCGISNYEEVVSANGLGLDIVITDHHEPPSKLPPAYAILNPKQPHCLFPFKELAGVGVAFNLAIALRARLREDNKFTRGVPNLKGYLDLVTLGTVADMVPLLDENRVFVKHGLPLLTKGHRPGIRALKEVSGLSREIKTGQVGFQLAPRINAAGRLTRADSVVMLLTTDDDREAMELARILDRENSRRQRIEGQILQEAIEEIDKTGIEDKKGIILAREGWHPGIIGIVASRLVELYYRPTILIALQGETGKGSARGIKAFHILDGLRECSALLERYGGHKSAAGLTISRDNISAFRDAFSSLIAGRVKDEDLTPEISLDAFIHLNEMDEGMVREMDGLAPFGPANPEPLLGVKGAQIVHSEVVGSGHLRLVVKQIQDSRLKIPGSRPFAAIAYGLGEMHRSIVCSPGSGVSCYDLAFTPYMDEWNGRKELRLKVREIEVLETKNYTQRHK